MNTDRIEEIHKETSYPESVSVQQALLKVWNECHQTNKIVVDRLTKENSKLTMDRDDNAMACSMLEKENEALKAGVKVLRDSNDLLVESLESVGDYWNGGRESAVDACEHAVEISADGIKTNTIRTEALNHKEG